MQNVVTLATRKANFDCWELEWAKCWDVAHEVEDGYLPMQILCNEINFGVVYRWSFITNCEEIGNNLSKLNFRSHLAENCIVVMIRWLGQTLTRVGCLQAFQPGQTVEETCPAEMADYDQVYYDSVTGASLPSKLCEEAMQLEIK